MRFPNFLFFLLANALITQTAPTPSQPSGGDEPPTKRPRLDGPQESGVPCPDYAQCGIKGKFYWSKLIQTIQLPNPEGDMNRSQIFNDWYGAAHEVREDAGQEISQDLTNHGLSPIDEYHNWFVFAKLSENGQEDTENNPYKNLVNTKDGVIVATYNYRDEDKAQKLKWSDIIYETYLRELEEENQSSQTIADLQTVVRTDIVNEGTINVAKAAYKSNNTDFNADSDWKKWSIAETPYWFYGLLGTDNVKGVVWLLKDHAQALKSKVITEIWTRKDLQFDIWINIGPYDPKTMQGLPS